MEREHIQRVLLENIKDNGKMENNTEMVNFSILEIKLGKKEFGAKEKEFDGLMRI